MTACTPVVDGEQIMTVSKVTGSGKKQAFKKPQYVGGVGEGGFDYHQPRPTPALDHDQHP